MEAVLGGEEPLRADLDPVALELNRLHNQLKEKESELGAAQSEIKALRAAQAVKDKALQALSDDSEKLDDKLRLTQNLLDQKTLEMKKLENERREALAAQYAAESTLRRVYVDQKDDHTPPIDSLIAPLVADIKMYKTEIAALTEDKKALERLTKSKELALLEAEKILRSALERALIVEEVRNRNFELKRQIEICQEENRILDKAYRQKVSEVEKLTQTINELEEAILAGGAAANTIRDYQRQISELNDEKRTLERELARVKVSTNRVAAVVANEWKDDNDKVIPVKQWLEERRLLQAEAQRLREKLSMSERTAKAEAQLKNKLKLRLKTLEEGLKNVSSFSLDPTAFCGSPEHEKSGKTFGSLVNNAGLKKRAVSQPRASTISKSPPSQQPDVKNEKLKRRHGLEGNMLKKILWAHRKKAADNSEKENKEMNESSIENLDGRTAGLGDTTKTRDGAKDESTYKESGSDDVVSGFLYDRLQKEVIALRKSCEGKDNNLRDKDEEIKMLNMKVDSLRKAIEVEFRRMKREAAATKEKDKVLAKMDDDRKNRAANSKRFAKPSS